MAGLTRPLSRRLTRIMSRVRTPGQIAWWPMDLGADLLAWWDPYFGVTLAGSKVSAWTDRKSGLIVSQSVDASRPGFSVSGFGGRPALTYDGIAQILNMEAMPFPSGAQPFEVWAVVQQSALPADTSSRRIFSAGGTTLVSRYLRRFVSGGVNRINALSGDGAALVQSGVPAIDASARHSVRGIFSATGVQNEVDGTAGTVAAVVPATSTDRFNIGGSSSSAVGAEFWQGMISDIIVTRPLATDPAARMRQFAARRAA